MAAQSGQGELGVLVECLKNSLSGHDRNKQKEAELVSFPHPRVLEPITRNTID